MSENQNVVESNAGNAPEDPPEDLSVLTAIQNKLDL